MAFDPETVKSIENEALGLKEEEVIEQPPIPVEIYTSEFTGYLGQMAKDSAKWIDTGYDYQNNKTRGDILLSMLVNSQAEVKTNRKVLESAPQRWSDEKVKVETERKRLLAATRIVCNGDAAAEATIKEVSSDLSNTGMVLSIIALIKLAEPVIDKISKIKIDNVKIDKTYLDTTKEWAEELISVLGVANSYRTGHATEITYRNSVITLCQRFLEDLKVWLPGVYFNDPETQKKFASSYYSGKNPGNGGNTKPNPPSDKGSKGPKKGKGKGPGKGSKKGSDKGTGNISEKTENTDDTEIDKSSKEKPEKETANA